MPNSPLLNLAGSIPLLNILVGNGQPGTAAHPDSVNGGSGWNSTTPGWQVASAAMRGYPAHQVPQAPHERFGGFGPSQTSLGSWPLYGTLPLPLTQYHVWQTFMSH